MIRILTSMIRNAPGPLRGARALTADFLEGLIDVVSPPADEEPSPPPVKANPPHKKDEPVTADEEDKKPTAVKESPSKEAEPEKIKADEKAAAPADLDTAIKEAFSRPKLTRRQDFKVLAIFFEADRQDRGALTAKSAANFGGEIGLTIRHENIRKVVRTRLEEKVETSTVPESQPPTFQYTITDMGRKFFVEEYLRTSEI